MKHGIGRKLLSVVLAVMMLVSLLPTAAFAEGLSNGAETTGTEDVGSANLKKSSEDADVVDDGDDVNPYADEGEETVIPTATNLVTVNGTGYTSLADAIANATPVNGVITYEINGKADISGNDQWISFVKDATNVKKVVFIGKSSDAEISITSSQSVLGVQDMDIDVELKDLTLSHPNGAWVADLANATNYFACMVRSAGHTVTYNNCTFPNGVCNNQYGKTVFEGCKFTSTSGWNLWNTSTGTSELNNCTFTGARGVKLYAEGSTSVAGSVTVKNTAFDLNDAEKAAIEITKPGSVELENVSVSGTTAGTIKKNLTDGYSSVEKMTVEATGTGISGSFTGKAEGFTAKDEFNISAGTFTSAVSEDYLADGFTIADDGNGNFGVTEEVTSTAVAKIGDKKYATLDEALAYLTSLKQEDLEFDASPYALTLLNESAWAAAKPVYWAAGERHDYVATLAEALTAAYKANAGKITIVCRPGADVGTMTHGHVADNITIFGNKAYVSGGECDLEVDTYKFSRETGKQDNNGDYLKNNVTILAYQLDNLGVWGQRNTDNIVAVSLVDCDSVNGITAQRVYISGTSGQNAIVVTDCDFETAATAIYSNADGRVEVYNCIFENSKVPVNINHKAAGKMIVDMQKCTFTKCGDAGEWKQFAAPVRFVNSGSGTMETGVRETTFTDTVGTNGDILLGDGRTGENSNDVTLHVSRTDATIQAQKPGYYNGDTTDTAKMAKTKVKSGETLETTVEKLLPAELTNYATVELTFGSNVSAEDIAAAKAQYEGKQYETCKAANEAYMALFGVTWGKGYLDVTDNTAPLYKYAGVSGSVTEVKYYIHGTMAGFTSLQSSGNQIDCTVGGNHQIFRTSVSIIGVNDANGNKAKLTDGNVQAYVAGGYESMFTASGKLTIDNIEFTTTSTTVGASAATGTNGSSKKATGEMEIKNCKFNGRLYVYDNFDNTGMTYNIHDNVFDGTNYSGDSNAYAIFAQCRGGNKLTIEKNTISGFARGINIDHANVAATIKDNTISITDKGRSCIQLSSLTKAEITGNTLNLTGGNAVTLHEKLLTMASAPEISFTGNTVTGTGYLVYDDAVANSKSFTSENLTLTVGNNTVEATVDTTQGVKGNTKYGLSKMVDEVVNPAANAVAKIGDKEYATLADAINAATAGQTVTLLADATEDVTINKDITLDLGGKTLTNTNAGKATVTIAKGATATVQNGSIIGGTSYYNIQNNGTATFKGVTATAGNTGSSMIDNFGDLTINSGTYTGGLDTVKNESGAKLTITGGTFELTKGNSDGFTGVVFNYGNLTITGGTFIQSEKTSKYGFAQVIYTDKDKNSSAVPSTVITGGTFTNLGSKTTAWTVRESNAAAGATKVSGGTFNKKVAESYWAEGYGVYATASGEYTAMPADKVARLGSYNYYTTLEEAIAAVGTGVSTSAIVYLLKEVTIDTQLVIDNSKAITLDLNGFTLTSTYAIDTTIKNGSYALVNNTPLIIKNGTFAAGQARAIGAYAKLTLTKATVTQQLTGGHACVAFCANDTAYTITNSKIDGAYAVCSFANNATIKITGSELNGSGCGLYHNGSNCGLKLTVTDTKINGSLDGAIGNENDPSGVYISGSTATVEKGGMQSASFTNCTIKGATAIEVKYTDLKLDECTVEATVKTPSYSKNNNGMTALGFAVVSTDNAMNNATPKPEGTVTITGKGNYTGLVGLGALKSVKKTYKDFADGTIKVSGGTFDNAVLPEYCADGFIPTKNADGTFGVKQGTYVAETNGVKYESLQAAIDAAKSGATVKMLADTKENVTISRKLTLDLNGFTLNGGQVKATPALKIDNASVTVKDSSENQNGTIMREDTAENSGVSSHYVIDIQGKYGFLKFEGGNVKNDSGNDAAKGASLIRLGNDSVSAWPTLTIKGGKFTQDNFIAIKVDRGTLHFMGGEVNSANSYAIENWNNAYIKGGTVNGTVSTWVYSTGAAFSKLEISGGTVNGNVASVNYDKAADKQARVYITGGEVTGTLGTYTYNNGLDRIENTSMATIEVTAGTFDIDPTKYVVEGSTVKMNSEGKFGVEKAYLAKIGETSYYTMDEAFHAVKAGETIVMLRDYTTDAVQNSGYDSFTIDLNEHTWTYTGTDTDCAAFEINYSDVTLTVKNGKVVSNSMVGLIPSAMSGTITYDNAGLVFENVVMTANGHSGIETNGGNTNDTVTLKNSTLNVPNGFGIYFPSSGKLTIDNSTINAKTMGVQVCAGSLSINDGSKITVNGDAVPKTENDGAIQDGAAISIVNRTGYKGLGKIEVTGGTFKANGTNAAIKAYDWANNVATEFTANDKVAVSGGTFSSAVPAGLCAEGFIPTKNENGTYGVKEGKYVAEYNGTQYTSLQEAIDAASQRNGGQTEVTLLCDLTITETVVFAKKFSSGSVLLNLGGYTLTGNDCRALQINKGNLYLENGTVTSIGDNIVNSSSVIRIGSNEAEYSGISPMLYMRNGAKVLAPKTYGVTLFGSATVSEQLTVSGNASIVATGPSPAISGNGDKAYHVDGKGTKVTITGNAVVSATNNYAIYHPDNGTLNIQGGTVSGKGGIQMCSGTLNISGSPKIEALGKANHETGAAGPIYDIAAISVVNRGYPGGAPVVTIKGTPTVTADEGEVIHAYTWSSGAESEWAEAGDNINVSGGTYSKTFNEAYLAADCTLVDGENGTYTVEQKPVAEYNGTKYTSLAQAILDANKAGGTVKLLEDVTLTNSLGIGGTAAVTLNLNKKTLTLNGAQIYTQGSAAVIINSGTIKRIDTPTSGSANNFAIQVMSGSSLTLGAGIGSTYKVTLESTYGIYNVGGTLTVRYATINTDGWSIAVSDSASKTGEVYIGRGMGGNTKTVITSESGNVLGTMVNSKPNVTIDYGTLTSNGTAWDAGVIYWASEGALTITGGIFNASNAEGSTAAAVYQKNGTVKISGTTTKLLGNNALVAQAGDGSTGTMVTELSAGTYSTKPDEAWVVEGKEIHETDDGLYKVEGPYVVEVTLEDGTVTKYDSWFSAFTNGTAQYKNAIVKLLKDIETTTLVSTYANVTIDFNGHTLAVSSSNKNDVAAITLLTGNPGTANVTLKDSVGNGGLKTTGTIYGVTVAGTGATLTVESGNYNCETTAVQVENGTAYIEGGTFQTVDTDKSHLLNCIDTAFKAGTAKMEVTGGTFYGFDPSANPEGEGTTYVKTGYVSANNGDGTYTVEKVMVAQIGEVKYGTLSEAIAAATDGDTITLLADIDLDEQIATAKAITIDGQGKYTIKATKKLVGASGKAGMFYRTGGAGTLTFLNVTLDGNGVSKIFLNEGGAGETVFDGVTSINGGGIAYGSGIHISGGGSHATIRNSTLTGSKGTMELNEANYYAANDLWVGGNVYVTVENSTIGTVFVNSAPSATATNGVVHGQLTITGENTKITYLSGEEEAADKLDKFGNNGSLVKIDSGYVETIFDMGSYEISGGTFKTEVKPEWCAEGFIPHDNNDGTYTVKSQYVAMIGDTKYTTLSEALKDAAKNDGTVLLVADVDDEELVHVRAGVTLNLNGHSITKAALIIVTGRILDTADANARGIISADDYVITPLNGYTPVYNSAKGGYSFFDLWVKSDWISAENKGRFAIGPGNEPERTAAKKLMEADLSRVDAVITFSWEDQGTVVTQEFTFQNEKMLGYLRLDKGVLTVVVNGLDQLTGSVKMRAKFVFYKADGAELFTLYGDPVTVK